MWIETCLRSEITTESILLPLFYFNACAKQWIPRFIAQVYVHVWPSSCDMAQCSVSIYSEHWRSKVWDSLQEQRMHLCKLVNCIPLTGLYTTCRTIDLLLLHNFQAYQGSDSSFTQCLHHPGVPIFHEG